VISLIDTNVLTTDHPEVLILFTYKSNYALFITLDTPYDGLFQRPVYACITLAGTTCIPLRVLKEVTPLQGMGYILANRMSFS
jgi:hypothetical protein